MLPIPNISICVPLLPWDGSCLVWWFPWCQAWLPAALWQDLAAGRHGTRSRFYSDTVSLLLAPLFWPGALVFWQGRNTEGTAGCLSPLGWPTFPPPPKTQKWSLQGGGLEPACTICVPHSPIWTKIHHTNSVVWHSRCCGPWRRTCSTWDTRDLNV